MEIKKFILPLFLLFFLQSLSQRPNGANGLARKHVSSGKTIGNGNQTSSGSGTLGLSYTATACGLDYKAVSVVLMERNSGSASMPVGLAVSGIPAGAIIVKAFLYTAGPGGGSAQNATLNSTMFPMTIIGSGADICWSYPGTYAYFADVTTVVTGNGTYTLSGLLTDPGLALTDDMNGATLIVIYKDLTANYMGNINISDGLVTSSGGITSIQQNINVACTPTSGRAFDIVVDLQAAATSSINATNAPLTANWWNYVDVATTYSTGQTSSTAYINSVGDCYAMTLFGTYYRTNCTSLPISVSTVAIQSPLCFAASNGSAAITATNGTGPYTYTWLPSGGSATAATGLGAGIYSISVQDANLCLTTQTISITGPTVVSPSVNATNVLCNGGSTGAATVTSSGGTGAYTYSWSTAATTSVVTGLNTGVKTVTVTDANNCTGTGSINISQPTSLTVSVAGSSVLCFGGTSGSATVTASGGTSPYTYSWSSVGSTSVVTGLNAGAKTVTVTDANNCTATGTITITEPATAVSAATAVTNVACNGGSTGAATVTASGGTGAYTYSWSTAATTSVITGLNAGVKTVTVTDANNCSITKSVTVTQPAASLSLSIGATSVLCNGGSNGSATVTTTGGTTPYTYSWSTGATTSVITTLNAGARTVTITDAGNCTASQSVSINQPAALTTVTTVINVLCFGNATGSATVTVSGGTAPYAYVWSSGTSTSVVTGLIAGVKTVTITDANNCTITNSVTITQPASALASATAVTNVLCNGGSTGAATVTASGGTSPYTYLWSSAATTSVITGLNAGVRTVTVTDANNCTTTNTVNITQPPALTGAVSVTSVLCNGGSNGSATVTASGGTGAYTYSWSTGATTSVITTLNAGVRTVTVTDANNCTITQTATINQPTALASTTAVTNVLCNGNSTGSATVTASGGTSPYTYLWSTAATTSVISGLNAGVRTVTVTDSHTCTTTNTISITQPASALSSATVATGVLCNGGSTGAATLTASGGTAPYTYSWSSGATTSVVTTFSVGIKTVTVTDANNCTTTNTVNITQPPALTIAVNVTSVTCNAGTNGSATVTAGGGTGALTYSWSSGGTSTVVSGLNAGVRTVTVTDANNCKTPATYTITEPSPITAVTSQTTITCVIFGRAEVIASGGIPGYTYSWSPVGGVAAITSTLNVGTYTCTITDANNCQITKTVQVLSNLVYPTVTIVGPTVSCSGNTISFSASGADTYSWSTGSSVNTTTDNPTSTTIYYVYGTYTANGCAHVPSQTVIVNPLPTVSVNSGSICSGQSFTITTAGAATYTITGGSAVVSPSVTTNYSVTGTSTAGCLSSNTAVSSVTVYTTPTIAVNSGTICSGNSFLINPSGAATYTITGGATVVSPSVTSSYSITGTSTAGCLSSNTAISTVTVLITPTIVLTASQNTICLGDVVDITASGAANYTWSTGSNSVSLNLSPSTTTNYFVTGMAASGCTAMAFTNITVNNLPTVIMNGTTALCTGNSVTLQATGANTYSWSTSEISPGITVTPSVTTVYAVQGTDGNGCKATVSKTITVHALPQVTVSASSFTICRGNPITLSGVGAVTYTWDNQVDNGVIFRPAKTNTYTVIGEDANGCINTSTIEIIVKPSPTVNIDVTEVEIGYGESYTITPSAQNAFSYTWSPAIGLDDSRTLTPISTPGETTTYTIIASSVNGCRASNTIKINVVEKAIVIANFMSPNGDGKNDTWKVNIPYLIKDYSVQIVDSYGQLVYSKSDHYENEFDGKRNGEDLPDGVYYYFIKNGTVVKYKGSITLTK